MCAVFLIWMDGRQARSEICRYTRRYPLGNHSEVLTSLPYNQPSQSGGLPQVRNKSAYSRCYTNWAVVFLFGLCRVVFLFVSHKHFFVSSVLLTFCGGDTSGRHNPIHNLTQPKTGMPWGPKGHPIALWRGLADWAGDTVNAQTTSSNSRYGLYQSKMSSAATSSSPSTIHLAQDHPR